MDMGQLILLLFLFGIAGMVFVWAMSKWPIPETIKYVIMAVIGVFFLFALIQILGVSDWLYVELPGRAD